MAKNKLRVFAVTAIAAAAALGLTGYAPLAKNTKKIIWDYLGQFDLGIPTYLSATNNTLTYDISNGEPKPGVGGYTTDLATLPIPDLPSVLLRKIAVMLPESLNIAGNPRVTLSGDDQTNIVFSNDTLTQNQRADIYVSFLSEGAGYRNSVGYFTYDPDAFAVNAAKVQAGTMTREQLLATITTEKIFLPNASQDSPSSTTPPPLKVATDKNASTVKFHVDPIAGAKQTGVGFFIVADGWGSSRDLTLVGGKNPPGTTSTPGVDDNSNQNNNSGKRVFYSLKALNPEPADARNLNQHTILLNESTVQGREPYSSTYFQRLILGFEDMPRTTGDNDFNDVLLAVHVSPSGPMSIANLMSISQIPDASKDSDRDGVNDLNDAYPNDPTAASFIDYPSSNGWGTLAYEDMWPAMGDFDLNDMVVRYRMRQIKHAKDSKGQEKTARLEMSFRLDARGAGYDNGFAIALPGIAPGDVYVDPADTKPGDLSTYLATIDSTGKVLRKVSINPVAEDTSQAVFEIFKSAREFAPDQTDSNCKSTGYYNTSAGCSFGAFTEFRLVVKMKTDPSNNFIPTYKNSFPGMPFDPFLFRSDNIGIEVHLPGKQPSARADRTLFNTGNDEYKKTHDASQLGTSYTYMTANGLPWALNIPALWDYPSEGVSIDKAYSNFITWAKSGGTTNKDWYTTPSDKDAATYGKSDKASLQAAKTFRNGRAQP